MGILGPVIASIENVYDLPVRLCLKYVGEGYRPRANRYRVTHAFRMSITSPCGQEGV